MSDDLIKPVQFRVDDEKGQTHYLYDVREDGSITLTFHANWGTRNWQAVRVWIFPDGTEQPYREGDSERYFGKAAYPPIRP